MKKIIVLLLLVCSMQLRGQTKEETIQWIHEYGSKIMLNPCLKGKENYTIDYKLRDNSLIFYNYHSGAFFDGLLHREVIVSLSDIFISHVDSIKVVKMGVDYYSYPIETKANAVWNQINWKDGSVTSRINGSDFYLWACSEKEVKQLAKAIMHLASFYGALPKPRVNKDTF